MSQLVSLDRLAGRLRVHPEHATRLVERHGSQLQPDWDGRPSVPVELAAEIVDATERQRAEHAAQERAYKAYQREWTAARNRVAQDAAREGHERGRQAELRTILADGRTNIVNGWAGGRQAAEAGTEAARDAIAEYDRKNPLLSFSEWSKKKGKR